MAGQGHQAQGLMFYEPPWCACIIAVNRQQQTMDTPQSDPLRMLIALYTPRWLHPPQAARATAQHVQPKALPGHPAPYLVTSTYAHLRPESRLQWTQRSMRCLGLRPGMRSPTLPYNSEGPLVCGTSLCAKNGGVPQAPVSTGTGQAHLELRVRQPRHAQPGPAHAQRLAHGLRARLLHGLELGRRRSVVAVHFACRLRGARKLSAPPCRCSHAKLHPLQWWCTTPNSAAHLHCQSFCTWEAGCSNATYFHAGLTPHVRPVCS